MPYKQNRNIAEGISSTVSVYTNRQDDGITQTGANDPEGLWSVIRAELGTFVTDIDIPGGCSGENYPQWFTPGE